MFKYIFMCFILGAISSCAALEEMNNPFRNASSEQVAKLKKEKNEETDYACSENGSYEIGFNDSKNGRDMNSRRSLSFCGNKISKLSEFYKKGFLDYTNNSSSSKVYHSRNEKSKSCLEAYGKKACGFDCKQAYGEIACAQNPEDNCVVAYGKIRCGFNCEEKFGQIKCGEEI